MVGSFQWDEPHKDWSSVNAALDSAGLKPFRLCLTTLLNLASGPWKGAAMFGNLSGSAQSYFSSSTPEDPLFQHFYDKLAWEQASGAPLFGSDDSLRTLREQMQDCPFWNKKGDLVKSCRWFSLSGRVLALVVDCGPPAGPHVHEEEEDCASSFSATGACCIFSASPT